MKLEKHLFISIFRTHAHGLSTVITGYRYRNHQYKEIARGDPQKPQTFYPMHTIEELHNGDIISARCTYNTTMKDTATQIGESILVVITYFDQMKNIST